MDLTNVQRAQVLVEALPYIQEYYGKIVVVKYGDSAMNLPESRQAVMGDIALLSLIGIKVVLVHGGSREVSETLDRMGKESEFLGGTRVTDAETADIVQMVLSGRINKSLVGQLCGVGAKAIGLSGIDGWMIEAEPSDERLGFVGDIVKINPKPILDILEKGYIPVISPVGHDKQGNVYDIDSHAAAARIAGILGAENLILMTDSTGILRDKNDVKSLISAMNVSEVSQLIKEGIITGSMIPRVNCCVEAIRRGVKRVVILDGRIPHSILVEILTDEGIGTMFR